MVETWWGLRRGLGVVMVYQNKEYFFFGGVVVDVVVPGTVGRRAGMCDEMICV